MKRQFPAFRGLAIVIVVFFHSIVMVNDIPVELGYPPMEGWRPILLSILGSLGIFAVPTFLFISGSFFAYATQTRGKGVKFLYKVSWANIIHILWPYIIWSIAFYIAIFIGRGETYSISGYIKNLIVGYPYHFIPLLIFNYFLAPIFLLLGKRFGWILLLAIAIYQVILINLLHPGIFGIPSPHWVNYLAPPGLKGTLAIWGIYFPLGLIIGMNLRLVDPILQKAKFFLLGITAIIFILHILTISSIVALHWVKFLSPVTFLLFMLTIKRKSIPKARFFEKIGKRVYGVYLTHLLVLYFTLLFLDIVAHQVLNFRIILIPFLFALALVIPYAIMNGIEKSRFKTIYPYIFG